MTQLSFGRKKAVIGRIRGTVQSSRPVAVPAPTGGWNAVDSLTSMQPTDAVELWNMIPGRGGVSVRPGFVNKCYNIGDSTTEIRSVIGFNGPTSADSKLFVATNQGIYDVTSETDAPTLITFKDGIGGADLGAAGWASKTGAAGYCSWVNMVNSVSTNGKHYLLVCDEVNGYHLYDSDTGVWTQLDTGDVTGVDPGDLVHVGIWKSRVIFTERDSARLWYLTPGAIAGAATAIDVGSRAPHGGYLKGVYTWTYDGGAGIDDYLVPIMSAGDVLVWEGLSPIDTSFTLKGVWYVGDPPAGRRIACEQNGDLLILGGLGVIPISGLVAGGATVEKKYVSYKIQDLLRGILRTRREYDGWSLTEHPSYGIVLLNLPYNDDETRYETLCYSTDTQSWSMLTGINALCWESWWGTEFVGTDEGRVVYLYGDTDLHQTYSAPNFTFAADQIEWKLLTAFSSLDAPANLKRIHYIRPNFVTTSYPAYKVEARYDFDVSIPASIDSSPTLAGPVWDSSKWDAVLWGGQYVTQQPVYGAAGIGRWFSIALTGKSSIETILVGFDAIGEMGGML